MVVSQSSIGEPGDARDQPAEDRPGRRTPGEGVVGARRFSHPSEQPVRARNRQVLDDCRLGPRPLGDFKELLVLPQI